jgi:hypothetical protein
MRALVVLLLVANTAAADPIDLDTDDATFRLAETAGACDKGRAAFIASWCHEKPRPARYVRKLAVTARQAASELLALTLPVADHGKGFISSPIAPTIWCDAKACLFSDAVVVIVRSKVAAADVARVEIAFDTDGLWQVQQWWGPRATNLAVTLVGAGGKRLGDATLLQPRK